MRNVATNFQYLTRWFLLIGVMTGIFFSSGEGVQLFPFPVISDTTETNTIALRDESYKPYSLSLHNSAGFSVVLKAKVQKNLKHPAGADSFGNEFCPTISTHPPFRQISREITFPHSSILLTSASDRAPPIIYSQI